MSLFDLYIAKKMSGGGGGGSDYTLLASNEFEVSTTSTSEISVGTVTVPDGWSKDFIIYVKVRDKAGKRNGYFLGGDTFSFNLYAANGTTSSPPLIKFCDGVDASGKFVQSTANYGVYMSAYSKGSGENDGTANIKAKYNSNYGTIDGTYVVEVYALKWPNDDSPFK